MNLELFLRKIIPDKHLHACWLNSLSYLEYRGFRKITRSQATEKINKETLQHINEEVRHALLLKNLAIKIGGEEFSYYLDETMLSIQSFKNYFYNLDYEISQLTSSNIYHAVTAAVELRAIEIYRTYEILLQESQVGISVKTIIIDEEKHIDHFSKNFQESDEAEFRFIEEKCFNELWKSIII